MKKKQTRHKKKLTINWSGNHGSGVEAMTYFFISLTWTWAGIIVIICIRRMLRSSNSCCDCYNYCYDNYNAASYHTVCHQSISRPRSRGLLSVHNGLTNGWSSCDWPVRGCCCRCWLLLYTGSAIGCVACGDYCSVRSPDYTLTGNLSLVGLVGILAVPLFNCTHYILSEIRWKS